MLAVDPAGATAELEKITFVVSPKPKFTIESIRRTEGETPNAEYILEPDPNFIYSVNKIYRFGMVDPDASEFSNLAGGAAETVTYTIEGQLPLLEFV